MIENINHSASELPSLHYDKLYIILHTSSDFMNQLCTLVDECNKKINKFFCENFSLSFHCSAWLAKTPPVCRPSGSRAPPQSTSWPRCSSARTDVTPWTAVGSWRHTAGGREVSGTTPPPPSPRGRGSCRSSWCWDCGWLWARTRWPSHTPPAGWAGATSLRGRSRRPPARTTTTPPSPPTVSLQDSWWCISEYKHFRYRRPELHLQSPVDNHSGGYRGAAPQLRPGHRLHLLLPDEEEALGEEQGGGGAGAQAWWPAAPPPSSQQQARHHVQPDRPPGRHVQVRLRQHQGQDLKVGGVKQPWGHD